MSLIKDTWRQLVRSRLWPIALGLVAAAVAVPVLLAKSPAPAPAPAPVAPVTAASTADRLALEPAVIKADESQPTRRRHVLGARKDPFKPAPQPKAKVTKVEAPTPATPGVVGTGGSPSGGTSGGSVPAPVTPAPVGSSPVAGPTPVAPPKAKHYPGDSLTVRFGSADANPKSLLKTGEALPEGADDATNPVLVYLHLDKTGKHAIFLLDASVRADGDGTCVADGTSGCEELRMRAGDTEFLDVTDEAGQVVAQYQLDLLAIHPSKRTKAAAAKASKHVAKDAKAVTAAVATAASAAAAHHQGDLGAGVGALLGSL